jgi:hypothetical protein
VAFSPDGSRIVTGSADDTAKVWDARTGRALLELKGQHDPNSLEGIYSVGSVSFSSDGSRIVTGIGEESFAMDTWSGMGVVAGGLMPFPPQIPDNLENTEWDTQTAKVWDARTGQELKGERIPPETRSSRISPDGRSIAHAAGNRVELIALHPDAEELNYRRFLTRPDLARYREGYDEAKKIGDEFAARFYLNLLPPPQRALIRAEPIVAPLFARLLIRDDVRVALQAQPAADPEMQAACLKLAETWPEDANQCENAAWALVRDPGRPEADYQRGLRLARAACPLEPKFFTYEYMPWALGVAQYRCGLLAEALATFTRINALSEEEQPRALAFLALAQHRLGLSDQARTTLGRLREVMKNPQLSGDPEAQGFLREAETIELDQVFPADPFAH